MWYMCDVHSVCECKCGVHTVCMSVSVVIMGVHSVCMLYVLCIQCMYECTCGVCVYTCLQTHLWEVRCASVTLPVSLDKVFH